MNVTGLFVEENPETNTHEAVSFALKYFKDLSYTTSEANLTDPLTKTDIAVLAVPYVGANIANGFEYIVEKLNADQHAHWLLMLIKDDVLNKGELTIDDLAGALRERGRIDILRFYNMTSEKRIPLQTREMMEIMKACDKIHNQYK